MHYFSQKFVILFRNAYCLPKIIYKPVKRVAFANYLHHAMHEMYLFHYKDYCPDMLPFT